LSLPTLEQFEFHHVLEDLSGIAIVLFSAQGCGACKAMRRSLIELRHTRPEWHIFEVDSQRDIALTREFEVFHLPSLFLFHDGNFHGQLHSEPLPRQLLASIAARLSQPAEEAP
jgi:thioredoxin 1